MIQLSLSFNIPAMEFFADELRDDLSFIVAELATFGVDGAALDPYGVNGFAIRGEIDYLGRYLEPSKAVYIWWRSIKSLIL